MAIIEPNTEIYLIKSPIELSNDNQLNFASATAQHSYFASLPKVALTGATFQRKDGTIRWNNNMEAVLNYNYCMYKNTNYGNKWFYAFVTDVQWLSNDSCAISIKTDVWQTWQFDLSFRKCFVEREHVNSDAVGEHTMPEGLELGEYVCNDRLERSICTPGSNSTICMQVTSTKLERDNYPTVTLPTGNERIYNGIPQGCQIYGFSMTSTTDLAMMYAIIGLYDTYGKGDAILSLFIVPSTSVTWTTGTISGGAYDGQTLKLPDTTTFSKKTDLTGIPQLGSLNGYTPKNNKMYTYPYTYLYLSNNNGGDIIYHYEDFFNNSPSFREYSCLEQGGSMYVSPMNSKKSLPSGTGQCWNEGMSLGKLPQVSWLSDYYLNWQAQNATNIMVQTTLDALNWAGSTVGMMVSGAMDPDHPSSGGSVMGLASSVANTMQQIRQAKMVPEQAKGQTNTGSITYASSEISFIFRRMTIRYEYAKACDDYLTQFGYKVNSLKVPNVTGRANWNYVKTHGCNIIGDVPQTDLDEIKGLFNRGITIWHNPSTFLDYSQNNAIV